MKVADRQDIADLISAYSYGYDTLDWELFGSIFAPDAIMASPLGESQGRETIVARSREFRERLAADGVQTRHYQTNTLLNEGSDGRIGGRTLVFVAWQHTGEPGPTPMHTGEYRDEYVRTPDGWRIARREVVIDHD
jgi:hypothetical protein